MQYAVGMDYYAQQSIAVLHNPDAQLCVFADVRTKDSCVVLLDTLKKCSERFAQVLPPQPDTDDEDTLFDWSERLEEVCDTLLNESPQYAPGVLYILKKMTSKRKFVDQNLDPVALLFTYKKAKSLDVWDVQDDLLYELAQSLCKEESKRTLLEAPTVIQKFLSQAKLDSRECDVIARIILEPVRAAIPNKKFIYGPHSRRVIAIDSDRGITEVFDGDGVEVVDTLHKAWPVAYSRDGYACILAKSDTYDVDVVHFSMPYRFADSKYRRVTIPLQNQVDTLQFIYGTRVLLARDAESKKYTEWTTTLYGNNNEQQPIKSYMNITADRSEEELFKAAPLHNAKIYKDTDVDRALHHVKVLQALLLHHALDHYKKHEKPLILSKHTHLDRLKNNLPHLVKVAYSHLFQVGEQ